MAKKLELKRIDKEELERIVRSGNTSASLVRRARMILLYAECASLKDVAEELESDSNNVSKWRDRFIENGVLRWTPKTGPGYKLVFWGVTMLKGDICHRSESSIAAS